MRTARRNCSARDTKRTRSVRAEMRVANWAASPQIAPCQSMCARIGSGSAARAGPAIQATPHPNATQRAGPIQRQGVRQRTKPHRNCTARAVVAAGQQHGKRSANFASRQHFFGDPAAGHRHARASGEPVGASWPILKPTNFRDRGRRRPHELLNRNPCLQHLRCNVGSALGVGSGGPALGSAWLRWCASPAAPRIASAPP